MPIMKVERFPFPDGSVACTSFSTLHSVFQLTWISPTVARDIVVDISSTAVSSVPNRGYLPPLNHLVKHLFSRSSGV